MRVKLFILWLILVFESFGQTMNGVSLVNPPRPIDSLAMASVHELRADWVAVIPYAFSRTGDPHVWYHSDRQWWGERLDGSRELVRLAQLNGLKVMLKPHIWMQKAWIGDYSLSNEEDWLIWESQYLDYILTFAKMAEEMQVPLFCIGTELKKVVKERVPFWRTLITEVRAVYSGALTYAANWDNYSQVPFWEELDYIGVDAYFPLVHEENPCLSSVLAAWRPLEDELQRYAQSVRRPVLFTEYGYQSAYGALGNHWEVDHDERQVSMEVQRTGYEALFQSIWGQEWFAGGFLWKWHFRSGSGGEEHTRFTPQGKPAAKIIADQYGSE